MGPAHPEAMDGYRIGRVVRALRHARNWTQRELGSRSGCHGSVISRLERGNLRACSLVRIARILDQLDARLVLSVQWRGGELDRLLDADHARLGERWARIRPARWTSRAEVTYNHYGDRGSIDDLSFDSVSGTLLVTELKTGVYDAQRALAKLDEKARVASGVARRFGWVVRRVIPALVLAESRTNRRRIGEHRALFARFDCRGRAARAWLREPSRAGINGLLLFVPLSDVRGMHGRRAGRQRVRPPRLPASVARVPGAALTADRGA